MSRRVVPIDSRAGGIPASASTVATASVGLVYGQSPASVNTTAPAKSHASSRLSAGSSARTSSPSRSLLAQDCRLRRLDRVPGLPAVGMALGHAGRLALTAGTEEFAAQEGHGQLTAPLLSAVWTSLSAPGLPLPASFDEKLQKIIDILQQAVAF
jgi:hypothetical protein